MPLTEAFLEHFKRSTEAQWAVREIDPRVYGFQFQRGTRWNPGLSDAEVADYQAILEVQFPQDLIIFFRMLNGTDLATVNIYGSCGLAAAHSVGVYAFPRDLEIVRGRIEDVRESRAEIKAALAEQGFDLNDDADLVPIFGHRYVMCTSDRESSVVLSVVVKNTDAILHSNSLQECLEREFLG